MYSPHGRLFVNATVWNAMQHAWMRPQLSQVHTSCLLTCIAVIHKGSCHPYTVHTVYLNHWLTCSSILAHMTDH